jgi:hypothetical protein
MAKVRHEQLLIWTITPVWLLSCLLSAVSINNMTCMSFCIEPSCQISICIYLSSNLVS